MLASLPSVRVQANVLRSSLRVHVEHVDKRAFVRRVCVRHGVRALTPPRAGAHSPSGLPPTDQLTVTRRPAC